MYVGKYTSPMDPMGTTGKHFFSGSGTSTIRLAPRVDLFSGRVDLPFLICQIFQDTGIGIFGVL